MLTTSGPGGIPPVLTSKPYPVRAEYSAPVRQVQEGKYDFFQRSPAPEGETRFCLEHIGRLSQEVRTAVTTNEIQSIRSQVHGGQYEPDPMSIAARMLLLEDVE